LRCTCRTSMFQYYRNCNTTLNSTAIVATDAHQQRCRPTKRRTTETHIPIPWLVGDVMSRTNWRYGVQQSEVPFSYMDYGNPYPVIRSESATGAFEWPLLLSQLLPGIHTNIPSLIIAASLLTNPRSQYRLRVLQTATVIYRYVSRFYWLMLQIHTLFRWASFNYSPVTFHVRMLIRSIECR
jgi:hypothetical protein